MAEDFNLYPLHVFRHVARLGSVTRAAEALFVSQPAVSAQIRALETRFGEVLLERTSRGVLLTEAGKIVLDYATRVFPLLEDLSAAVEASRGRIKGEVLIAASSTPAAYLLPGLLRRFLDRYPEAEPRLLVGDSAQVIGWLQDYHAALGVVGETAELPWLHRHSIASDELRLVVARNDPLRDAESLAGVDLSGCTLLLRERGSSTRSGAERLLGNSIKRFRRVEEIAGAEAIKQAVIAGLGVAIMSSWTSAAEEESGKLSAVLDPGFRLKRSFYVVRREDRTLVGAAAAFWRFLREETGSG